MRGQTNAIKPPITLETGISYSYDGVIWKKFGSDGTDIGGCAQVDFNTNIVQINASGYDWLSDTLYYDNDGGIFYIRIDLDCNLYYCLVGGGGGSSQRGLNGSTTSWIATGGGGGAGGQVVYNKTPYTCPGGTILKFQIGTGGAGGGGIHGENQPPQSGKSTILSKIDLSNNNTTVIQEALGGAAASNLYRQENQAYDNTYGWYVSGYTLKGSSDGGAGIAVVDNSNIYSKSSAGGKGGFNPDSQTESERPQPGTDGTTWPHNQITYGGGGGGAGGEDYYEGKWGWDAHDYVYAGCAGGSGGGGLGAKNANGAWDYAVYGEGQPGSKNTGGGAGGGNGGVLGDDYIGSKGGSGVCLIKIE